MSGVGDLLVGIGTVLGSLVSAGALAYTMIRASRKERSDTATKTAEALSDAVADGKLSPDEVAKLRALLDGDADA